MLTDKQTMKLSSDVENEMRQAPFAAADVMPPRNLSKCDGHRTHLWKCFPSGIVRCIHCEMDGKEHARLAYLYQLEKARWARRRELERDGGENQNV